MAVDFRRFGLRGADTRGPAVHLTVHVVDTCIISSAKALGCGYRNLCSSATMADRLLH